MCDGQLLLHSEFIIFKEMVWKAIYLYVRCLYMWVIQMFALHCMNSHFSFLSGVYEWKPYTYAYIFIYFLGYIQSIRVNTSSEEHETTMRKFWVCKCEEWVWWKKTIWKWKQLIKVCEGVLEMTTSTTHKNTWLYN